MLGWVTVYGYLRVVLRFVVLAAWGFILHRFLKFLYGTKSVGREIDTCTLDFGRLQYEFSERTKITLAAIAITEGMAHAITPETNIAFNPWANFSTDWTVTIGYVAALSPLVVKLTAVILCHDVLAVGFAKFHESANLMDYDATFLALEDIREPAVGQPAAQVAEVEWFLLWTLPFVLGWSELIAHDLVLHAGLGKGLGLQDEDAGHDCNQDGHHYGDGEEHILPSN